MGGNSSKTNNRSTNSDNWDYLYGNRQQTQRANTVFGSDPSRNSTRSSTSVTISSVTFTRQSATPRATPSISNTTTQPNPRISVTSAQNVISSNSSARPPVPPKTYHTPSSLYPQLGDDDLARAIELSLREHNTNRTSQPTSSIPTLRSSLPSQQININRSTGANVVRPKVLAPLPSANGQTTIECSICMEFNGNYEMVVVTRCGHVFHRECISPWIQQAGTCPKCRITISTASLLKIYVDSNATSPSNPMSKATNSRNSIHNNKTRNNRYSNHRNQNAMRFSRSVWLSSPNKNMTEQTLADFILQKFGLTSQNVSIKSLKKANVVQTTLPYVSFKISVDTENTFNILLRVTNWPSNFRVREFIERNRMQ